MAVNRNSDKNQVQRTLKVRYTGANGVKLLRTFYTSDI